MLSSLDLIVLMLILAVGLFFYVSKKSLARLDDALDKNKDVPLFQSQFKCVLISTGAYACKLSREYESKPILLNDVPALPLLGCNAGKCSCSFVHREDRRAGVDRRELQDNNRRKIHENKRIVKDRRRDSIREFLLPQPRSFT